MQKEAVNIVIPFLKQWEGCKLTAYTDQGGRYTIGYGSTGPDIEAGVTWTQEEAEGRLENDVTTLITRIESLIKPWITLNPNQLAALISFSYNLGVFNLERSGLLRKLNAGALSEAADQFLLWNRIGLYVSPGLCRRREAERALFLKPYVAETSAP